MISVYRRPIMSANLKFKTTGLVDTGVLPPFDLITGAPLAIDPYTKLPISGSIMADGREPDLQSQAIDATLGHAQAKTAPSAAVIQQIVDWENGIYSAQSVSSVAGDLSANGAMGGPGDLSKIAPGNAVSLGGGETLPVYDGLSTTSGTSASAVLKQSIYRGARIFNTRPLSIANTAGINELANPLGGTCSTCHNQVGAANDSIPDAQHDLGVAGDIPQFGGQALATDLPVFQLDCSVSGKKTSFGGSVVTTNDPGRALITGKCEDIGKITVPQLRGLAARAPYFHDGSAATLSAVVSFYNKRFAAGFTAQDQTDLVNFLSAL
jgi:cytochrome c peroxidase